MGKLLAYSGTTTKLRAMKSRLLTESDYRNLAAMRTVTDALVYLKKKPGYSRLFANRDETSLHRNEIENILMKSIYSDYRKIYRFAPGSQRRFLDVYFGRYETSMLKSCMRRVFDHQNVTLYAGSFREFFEKHSDIDLDKLSASHTMAELVESLKGSMYYDTLRRVADLPSPTLWDYGMALDLFYFKWMWAQKDDILKDQESRNIFMDAYGVKMDLLNIQWIYRSKKYFKMAPAQIYALLIPVQYRLKKEHTQAMTEAGTMEEFSAALRATWYGRHFDILTPEKLPSAYVRIRHSIQTEHAKKEPYSIATVISYLFEKEHEIDRLTTALEGIRYGLPQEEILSYLIT
ncbi:MAG: V-type ATPase subunit [Candidatus Limivivens sp.]|nr:V-type ATPase subunit [Candidatus Limivivens sp.]